MSGPLATVGALVVNMAGQVLIVKTHKWRGRWGVPGGKIAYGESMHAALLREFREETGLELSEVRWGPVQETIDSQEFHRPAHFILLNFIARTSGETVRLNEEAQDYRWLLPEEALGYPLNAPTRKLVEFYLAHGQTTPLLQETQSFTDRGAI